MPLYEYECNKCRKRFEMIHSSSKTPDGLSCPECGAPDPKKLLSQFCSGSGTKAMNISSGCGKSGRFT